MSATFFVSLAVLGASLALAVNGWAAAHVVAGAWRKYFLLLSAFSAFYVGAWGWILWHPDLDRGAWSETVTPISTLTFFTVWTGPAILVLIAQGDRKGG